MEFQLYGGFGFVSKDLISSFLSSRSKSEGDSNDAENPLVSPSESDCCAKPENPSNSLSFELEEELVLLIREGGSWSSTSPPNKVSSSPFLFSSGFFFDCSSVERNSQSISNLTADDVDDDGDDDNDEEDERADIFSGVAARVSDWLLSLFWVSFSVELFNKFSDISDPKIKSKPLSVLFLLRLILALIVLFSIQSAPLLMLQLSIYNNYPVMQTVNKTIFLAIVAIGYDRNEYLLLHQLEILKRLLFLLN
uniref:Uncharacterized protein n=1 Tax=Glossina brevipalpis TaxID=37001 RepID=A0A1A9WFE9_9MUSC